MDFCCQYLEREVSEENYLYLQDLALLYSLERLDTFIDHFILSRFETLSFMPDFLRDIPLNKLSSYLSSGKVNLVVVVGGVSSAMQVVFLTASLFSLGRQVQHDSEQALLQATLQWLSQSPERAAHARQLLSDIHFPLMPAGDLAGRVLPAVRALLPGEAGCEALVEEALTYHARTTAQPLLQTARSSLRDGVERLLLIGGEVKKNKINSCESTGENSATAKSVAQLPTDPLQLSSTVGKLRSVGHIWLLKLLNPAQSRTQRLKFVYCL